LFSRAGERSLRFVRRTDLCRTQIAGPRLRTAELPRYDLIGWRNTAPSASYSDRTPARQFCEATLRGQGIALIAEPDERNLPGLVRLVIDALVAALRDAVR